MLHSPSIHQLNRTLKIASKNLIEIETLIHNGRLGHSSHVKPVFPESVVHLQQQGVKETSNPYEFLSRACAEDIEVNKASNVSCPSYAEQNNISQVLVEVRNCLENLNCEYFKLQKLLQCSILKSNQRLDLNLKTDLEILTSLISQAKRPRLDRKDYYFKVRRGKRKRRKIQLDSKKENHETRDVSVQTKVVNVCYWCNYINFFLHVKSQKQTKQDKVILAIKKDYQTRRKFLKKILLLNLLRNICSFSNLRQGNRKIANSKYLTQLHIASLRETISSHERCAARRKESKRLQHTLKTTSNYLNDCGNKFIAQKYKIKQLQYCIDQLGHAHIRYRDQYQVMIQNIYEDVVALYEQSSLPWTTSDQDLCRTNNENLTCYLTSRLKLLKLKQYYDMPATANETRERSSRSE